MARVTQLFVLGSILCPVMIVAAWLVASADLPLGRDQGIFAWVGEAVLHGGLPYVDAWDVKGPGAHALYALGLSVFGETERGVRYFDIAFQLVALAAFLRAGWLHGSPLAGLMGFVLAIGAQEGSWWNTAQPDGWAGILLLWSVVLMLERQTSVAAMAGACLLIGAAALIKPIYILFGLVPLVRLLEAPNRERRLPLLFAAGASGAAPLAAAVAAYAIAGQTGAIWETLVEFNAQSHFLRHGQSVTRLVEYAASTMALDLRPAGLLALAGIGFVWLWRRNPGFARLAVAGVAVGAACAVIQFKFYPYHLFPYFYFLALLAGFGFSAITGYLFQFNQAGLLFQKSALALALLFPCVQLLPVARQSIVPLSHVFGMANDAAYIQRFTVSDFSPADTRSIAQFVAKATTRDDSIYLWGFDSLVYFLADRKAASRFGFNYPMIAGMHGYEQRRRELLDSLERKPPRIILVEDRDANNLMPFTSREYLDSFPELKALIEMNYAPVSSNERYSAYEWRGSRQALSAE
jgi:hypothetical protein